MDRWINEWIYGWIDEWINGLIDEYIYGFIDSWMNRWMSIVQLCKIVFRTSLGQKLLNIKINY